jgi:hypothetical protein
VKVVVEQSLQHSFELGPDLRDGYIRRRHDWC